VHSTILKYPLNFGAPSENALVTAGYGVCACYRASMKILITVLVSIVVSMATVVAMHFFIVPRLPVVSVDTPSLAGMTVSQARATIEPRGLRLVLDAEKPNNAVAAGTICEQRPLAGSMIRRGDEVHAVLAQKGDARVPRVAGMTPAAARELLERENLRAGESTTIPDATTPAGLVIGTTPAEGSALPAQASVTLRVSAGAMTTPVPSVYGKRLSTAKETLEKAGLQLGTVKRGSDDDRDSGEVISQTPKANEPAPIGSKVDLVVNE